MVYGLVHSATAGGGCKASQSMDSKLREKSHWKETWKRHQTFLDRNDSMHFISYNWETQLECKYLQPTQT